MVRREGHFTTVAARDERNVGVELEVRARLVADWVSETSFVFLLMGGEKKKCWLRAYVSESQ